MSVQYVKIYYGPYDAFHTISHKPQKLRGLKDRLQKLGYRVDLVPVDYVNYCMVEMCGHEVLVPSRNVITNSSCMLLAVLHSTVVEVFRCNIRNLHFNSPAELDPVCTRAVEAILDASAQFSRARNYLWFWALIDSQLFRRSGYAPKDHWPFDADPTGYDICLECRVCCGGLKESKIESENE